MKLSRQAFAAVLLAAVCAVSPAAATCTFYQGPDFSGPSFALNPGLREDALRAYMPQVGSLKASEGCRAVLYGDRPGVFVGAARRVSEPFRSGAGAASCECGLAVAPKQGGDATPAPVPAPAADPVDDVAAGAKPKPPRRSRTERAQAPSAPPAPAAPERPPAPETPDFADSERYLPDRVTPYRVYPDGDDDDRVIIGGMEIIIGGDRRRDDEPPWPDARGLACVAFNEPGYRGDWNAFEDGEAGWFDRPLIDNVASVRLAPGCIAVIDIDRGYKILVDGDTGWFGRSADIPAQAMACYCGL